MAAREVWRWFEDHLDALLEATRAFRFDQFELHLRTFWAGLSGDHREVVHAPAVAGLMAKADALLYDVSIFPLFLVVFKGRFQSIKASTMANQPLTSLLNSTGNS
jgi:hypothetical protein